MPEFVPKPAVAARSKRTGPGRARVFSSDIDSRAVVTPVHQPLRVLPSQIVMLFNLYSRTCKLYVITKPAGGH